ncbi:MAG TPA: YbhB/YbcL family Raf kinase inhibitor-like protein [Xanthobacteraceae bacterium]|nr:YbhB/YbcL family Raf kinase inhibitor-like protein [Xanthobacteraceae bacterium]
MFNNREVVGSDVAAITITSPAFADGGAIPRRHTADGPGLSPPLAWSDAPSAARALILLIEDADSPTMHPLVHGIVLLAPDVRRLNEGALPGATGEADAGPAMGRNSFFTAQYLPPDPPPGHGPHRYAFEVFALAHRPSFDETLGRARLIEELRGRVVAKGCLIGSYQRA